MSRVYRAVAVGVLVGTLAAGAAAQTTPPAGQTPPPAPPAPTLRVGSWVYDVANDEPVIAYVVGRNRVLDGTTTVTVQLLLQTDDGWRALPPYAVEAIGPFGDAQPGDALVLGDKVVNGG